MSGPKRLILVLILLPLAVTAWAPPASAQDRRELVAPYLRALEASAVGEVNGRAYGEPSRPSGGPVPVAGVSVLLVPFAAEVEARLDGIKTHLRDSITTYVEAHGDVSAVRAAYERELLAAGGGELIRGAVSDSAGMVRLEGVPAGEWLLLAWREDAHAVKGAKAPEKDAKHFPDIPVMTGYAAVSYWRTRVSVRPGETTSVNLSDRGAWLTVVREELSYPGGPPKKAGDYKRRR